MALIDGSQLTAQWRGLDQLPMLRQVGLLIGIALAIAVGVAIALWSQSPHYRVLQPDLPERFKPQLLDSLNAAGINHRLDPQSGAVMVPASDFSRARMQATTAGIAAESEKGYELLEQVPGFGMSERLESTRIRRALEGELTRSIRGLRSVEQARVHLAMPERAVFIRDREAASASVVVRLYPGRRLDEVRIAGMQELVAAAVPDLQPEDVAVLDNMGRLLSPAEGDQASALSGKNLALTRELEKTYIQRIESLLEPLFGRRGVRAQVSADLDFSQIERTSENYDPNGQPQPLIRSEQIIEDGGATGVAGVPGALTNQPPPAASLGEPGEAAPSAAGDQEGITPAAAQEQTDSADGSREVTRNYELDRRIEHTKSSPGRIQRLSVAVLVDNNTAADAAAEAGAEAGADAADGGTETATLSAARLETIEALVREAVGFNAERGDSIRVSAVNFRQSEQDATETLPEGAPFWQQDWLWDIGKQVLGAILLAILLLAVFRPTLKTLANPAAGVTTVAMPAAENRPGLPATANAGQEAAQQETEPRQEKLEYARSLAEQEPKRVAQLTRSWISGDE